MQRKMLSITFLLLSLTTLSLSAMDKQETIEQRRARLAAAAERRLQASREAASAPVMSAAAQTDALPTSAVVPVEEPKEETVTVQNRKRVRALSDRENADLAAPSPAVAPMPAAMNSAATASAPAERSALEDATANHFAEELFDRASNLQTFVSLRQESEREGDSTQLGRVIDALNELFASEVIYEYFTEINEQLDALLNALTATERAVNTEDYPVYLTIENTIIDPFLALLHSLTTSMAEAAQHPRAGAAVVDEDDEEDDALLQVALAMSTQGVEEARPSRRARSTRAAAAAANVALKSTPKGGGKRKK